MTLAMPDSVIPANLPGGYPAYLGYADGFWPTCEQLAWRFPHAEHVCLTVSGRTRATGCDVENGDLSATGGIEYTKELLAAGSWRPVIYASVSTMSSEILPRLSGNRIERSSVRLLSAHYDAGEHICGPSTCKEAQVQMDGTQWTDTFRGLGGVPIDMSALLDSFFGTTAGTGPSWEDKLLATIAVITTGSKGQAVANWQGLLVAHGYGHLLGSSGVDGSFGSDTETATRHFQEDKKVEGGADGVVGEHSWTAALSS